MQAPRVNVSQPPPLLATAFYTGADQATADGIAAGLFFNPNIAGNVAAASATLRRSNISVRCAGAAMLGLQLHAVPPHAAHRHLPTCHTSPATRLLHLTCHTLPATPHLPLSSRVLQTGTVYASGLSQLGLVMSTPDRGRDFYALYLEPAFVDTENVSAG